MALLKTRADRSFRSSSRACNNCIEFSTRAEFFRKGYRELPSPLPGKTFEKLEEKFVKS